MSLRKLDTSFWNTDGLFINNPIPDKRIVETDLITWVHKAPDGRVIGRVRHIEVAPICTKDIITIKIENVMSKITDMKIGRLMRIEMYLLWRHGGILRETWQDEYLREISAMKVRHKRELEHHRFVRETLNPPQEDDQNA